MAIADELIAILGYRMEGEDVARRYEARLKSITKNIEGFARAAGKWAGIAAGAVATGFAFLGKSVISASMEFERYESILTTIEGSSEKAKQSLNWVADFAKKTPYDLAGVTEAFVRLKAYGIDPITGDTLRILGDTASAMGKPIMAAVEMFADASTMEFERLKEFGLKAKQAGNEVTFTWSENGKELSKTIKKNSEDVRKFILDNLGKKFNGAMDGQSRTLTGILSNLGDRWQDFLRRIGDAGYFDRVKNYLTQLGERLDNLDKNGKITRMAQAFSKAFIKAADIIWAVAMRIGENVTFLAENFDKLKPYLIAAGVAFGLLFIYAAPVISAFIAIGFAIDDLLAYMQGAPSVIGSVIDWFKSVPEQIAAAWNGKIAALTEEFGQIGAKLRAHADKVKAFFQSIRDWAVNIDWSGIGSAIVNGILNGLRAGAAAIKNFIAGLVPDWIANRIGGGGALSGDSPAIAPGQPSALGQGFLDGMNNYKANADKAITAGDTTLNDNKQDNRNQAMNTNVTVNQTVTQATNAPGQAAQATGNAVAGSVARQRAQIETEPAF